jgi:hypothetical protein
MKDFDDNKMHGITIKIISLTTCSKLLMGSGLPADTFNVSLDYAFITATDWNNRSVCLSVYTVVNRNNSVKRQHVKIHLV